MTGIRAGLRRVAFAVALAGAAGCAPGALALQPDEVLPDPALEKRAREISLGLRCLVCQNQSIDDSDADVARDLRRLVRERLKAGDTDDQVRAYVVSRYGDYVLLKPPFDRRTLLLWGAPLLVLLLGGVALAARARRAAPAAPETLDDGERRALDALLRRQDGDA
ncbi:cytochrome c-type biogenesis protein [Camelimonas abortus]|uniref:Cytochrome c-type biogenesis protein n=1 Tax=Camelimonas abortus TaxID=1017184 RepID=A0ABV7LG78_9HYPH